jgi:hypothetical protein
MLCCCYVIVCFSSIYGFAFHFWYLHMLFLITPSCYCCYKPDNKPWMQKGPDCNYNKRKKHMKIPKVECEAVNRRKTKNNIATTKHVDFIHSFACQCHVYYTKYYNATCSAVNTHLFKTALNLLGEISLHPVSFIGTIVNIKIFNWISIKLGVIYIFAIKKFPISSLRKPSFILGCHGNIFLYKNKKKE